MPERGRIGIFNRSYYEEVLVARVHKEVVDRQKLPDQLMTKKIWENRLEDMAAYEHYLARNGMATLKFFLNISKAEQTKRFLARLEIPQKNWKFSDADMKEREYWKDYMHAYEDAIRSTASVHAPWYVVPANNKWFARLIVAAATVELLENLDLAYPAVPNEKTAYLAEAKQVLLAEQAKK
jgi:polyphosphate kinase 2 (PPK2 family)